MAIQRRFQHFARQCVHESRWFLDCASVGLLITARSRLAGAGLGTGWRLARWQVVCWFAVVHQTADILQDFAGDLIAFTGLRRKRSHRCAFVNSLNFNHHFSLAGKKLFAGRKPSRSLCRFKDENELFEWNWLKYLDYLWKIWRIVASWERALKDILKRPVTK